jgi:arabinose-5-phosphate isomerase
LAFFLQGEARNLLTPEGRRLIQGGVNTLAPHPDLTEARRVLALEADALRALSDILDDGFVRAVGLLAGVTGRVVVSGMGKSGHVARKIAATMASTGTPALFVHPAEASHGDLGMILAGDAVLALSNSGETEELTTLLPLIKRLGVPLVAMTASATSALGKAADILLLLPDAPEATDGVNAPTTSTTI